MSNTQKHFFQDVISLQATVYNGLSKDEILDLIPPDSLAKIKEKDAHPYFQAYSFCHEGVSTPRIIGESARPIRWIKKAVQSIAAKIKNGIKFFMGHNADNSVENREVLGEIVANTQRNINGALHHIAIGYFPNREIVENLDICSHEGDWSFYEENGELIADRLVDLTGIALESSDNERPAFAGAVRLGSVQAFENEITRENKMSNEPTNLSAISFDELKQEMKRRMTFPSQLYGIDEIKADANFKAVFDESETLKKTVEEKDAEIKKLKDAEATLLKQTNKTTAKNRLSNIIDKGETKYTALQKKFIEDELTDGAIDKMESGSDEELANFINEKLNDFNRIAKYDYLKLSEDTVTDNSSDAVVTGDGSEVDFTRANNNEFLQEDFNEEGLL